MLKKVIHYIFRLAMSFYEVGNTFSSWVLAVEPLKKRADDGTTCSDPQMLACLPRTYMTPLGRLYE